MIKTPMLSNSDEAWRIEAAKAREAAETAAKEAGDLAAEAVRVRSEANLATGVEAVELHERADALNDKATGARRRAEELATTARKVADVPKVRPRGVDPTLGVRFRLLVRVQTGPFIAWLNAGPDEGFDGMAATVKAAQELHPDADAVIQSLMGGKRYIIGASGNVFMLSPEGAPLAVSEVETPAGETHIANGFARHYGLKNADEEFYRDGGLAELHEDLSPAVLNELTEDQRTVARRINRAFRLFGVKLMARPTEHA